MTDEQYDAIVKRRPPGARGADYGLRIGPVAVDSERAAWPLAAVAS